MSITLMELLNQTMIGAGVGGCGLAGRIAPSDPLPSADQPYETAPIWSFGSPIVGGGRVLVRNVRCRVRSASYAAMQVFETAEWLPVTVTAGFVGGTVKLPLEPRFHIGDRFVVTGHIDGSRTLWPLPANLDQSFEMIFGYEFPAISTGACEPKPVGTHVLPGVESLPGGGVVPVCPADPEGPALFNTLRPTPVRIFVACTLVCCKEKYDFEPKGILGAARIYPMTLIVSSRMLESAEARVRLARPAMSNHCHAPVDHPPGLIKMSDGELMHPELRAAFFTDSNTWPNTFEKATLSLPYWDNVFDYYDTDPALRSYEMVGPTRSEPWEVKDAIEKLGVVSGWNKHSVRKMGGQGEFDNLHIAPRMTIHPKLIERYPLRGLDSIVMAPFCIHDCFHMHWRWGEKVPSAQACGWLEDGKPYSIPGAPLVPSNHAVRVELLSPSAFLYMSTAYKVPPGEWQVFCHHGGAYAVSVGAKVEAAKFKFAVERNIPGDLSWAHTYWWMRYDYRLGQQLERVRVAEGAWDLLRALGPAPVTAAVGR